jgi:hypothetical protein
MHKQQTKRIRHMLFDSLFYILKGGLFIKNSHLPQEHHPVPDNFIGVSVASNEDPAVDSYIIVQLETLGIKHVRLDFSYSDLGSFNERFLKKLISEDLLITLHLVPPFDAAKNMQDPNEQSQWRKFLDDVINRYGANIKQIEIGNTINRKRWAGYTLDSFFITWQIAYEKIKSKGIKLLGPNIQDFEPIYNIGILNNLQKLNQLPDVHTDNLFVERVIEPERFDHRVLQYRWSRLFKYNLVKKARILQKIGQDFGINQTSSSAAFWAIYRIKRTIDNPEQKQADYLTRYFTLLAASGALKQANWGALICNREGLINDGLTHGDYPNLERIAHYQTADGFLNQYERYPSFYALKTVHQFLNGAYYQSTIASAQGLEVHHFNQNNMQVHIAWTTNGKAAYLADIYAKNTLNSAKILDRDGNLLDRNVIFIWERPIYLCWDKDVNIEAKLHPKPTKNLAIHAYVDKLQYFTYNMNGWTGLILAKDETEANMLRQSLNPNLLNAPEKHLSLRHARNVIWAMEDPRDSNAQLIIKQPVKMYPHKALLDRFKPSKAKRSWNGAMELLRRDIGTAMPIAYFEKVGDSSLKQNYYFCEHVKADANIGQIFSNFAKGETEFKGISSEEIYHQFAKFTHRMHHRGVYFRDYSGGNILVNIENDKQLSFSLIDTARIHSFNYPILFKYRIADLTRACHKLHKPGRHRFMQIYLGLSGKKFNLVPQLRFVLYDFKVKLKRTVGRKGIKRLLKRFKNNH